MAIPELPPVSGGQAQAKVSAAAHTRHGVDLAQYEVEDLVELRTRIDQMLPTQRLMDVNLESELVRQLTVAKRLQSETLGDTNCPANQKSQVLNAAAAAISALAKLQVEVYSSERLKKIEQILIDTLNTLPAEAQAAFIDRYEALLG